MMLKTIMLTKTTSLMLLYHGSAWTAWAKIAERNQTASMELKTITKTTSLMVLYQGSARTAWAIIAE